MQAVGAVEQRGQIGEGRVVCRQRQAQARQPFGQIKGDMQGKAGARIRSAVALVAAPQANQPPAGAMDGNAEIQQLRGTDARRVSGHRLAGDGRKIDGLVEESHKAIR